MNSRNIVYNLSSKLFQPINIVPQNVPRSSDKIKLSKGHKLMMDLGIIRASSTGIYSILPLGIRSLDKMRKLIKLEMSKLHAQEIKLPYLTDSSLWKKSGRWNSEGLGIYILKDRHNKENILSPTNEEMVTDLISSIPQISQGQLPLLIYQMSTKFRDELKPRCGLLKSKEFEMKDLYSFDKCLESAKQTYHMVAGAYNNIFDTLGLPVLRVNADTGDMRGIFSHEYHICSDLGEDVIIKCNDCLHSYNSELNEIDSCEQCQSKSISRVKGIEVGHTFLLDTVYSKPLNAVFKASSGTNQPLVMASYGLGLTRTLAAGVEFLSSDDNITWPSTLAPFSVVIITPKNGSKEYEVGKRLSNDLYLKLNEFPHLNNDVLIDDQENMTIGKRLLNIKRVGYPIAVVIGSKVSRTPPIFEVIDIKCGTQRDATFDEAIDILTQNNLKNLTCNRAIG